MQSHRSPRMHEERAPRHPRKERAGSEAAAARATLRHGLCINAKANEWFLISIAPRDSFDPS